MPTEAPHTPLPLLGAIVSDRGGLLSHAAIAHLLADAAQRLADEIAPLVYGGETVAHLAEHMLIRAIGGGIVALAAWAAAGYHPSAAARSRAR